MISPNKRKTHCYSCTAIATTREHVPPKCLFPDRHRPEQMVTVPSCELHNIGNSQDVEYVRNILASPIQVNEIAREFVTDKINRSYDRSPKLLSQTFKEIWPVIVNGEQTAAFSVDMERLDTVMRSIAYGIYRHHFGRNYLGSWTILSTQFLDTRSQEENYPWEELKTSLNRIPLTRLKMPEPRVFDCGIYVEDDHNLLFGFNFYEGLLIHAFGVPFWKKSHERRKRANRP